jgi:hypothetical protein
VAIVVLMVVLMPVAYLLSSTTKIAASNQRRLTAQSLAASWLEQERTAGEQPGTSPPSVSFPTGAGASAWPAFATTETVGTTPYYIYLSGGWCAYGGSQAAWGNSPSTTTTTTATQPPITFFIAVKVKWGPDASKPSVMGTNDGAVVEYSSVETQPGWIVTVGASPGTPASVLTLNSTSNITNNYCPLVLT